MQDKSTTSANANSHSSSLLAQTNCTSSNSNREYIKTWIREQSQRLNEQYFTTELQGSTHPALIVLNRLIAAIHQLDQDVSKYFARLAPLICFGATAVFNGVICSGRRERLL